MNETGESCSSNPTGSPQALSRRNTLQVVALASLPLSGMTSCLAPSPAVMSSLETSATSSVEPLIRWILLVLPSVTSAPSVNFEECGVLASKAGSFVCFEKKRPVYHCPDRAANSTFSCPPRQLLKKVGSAGPAGGGTRTGQLAGDPLSQPLR